VDLGDQFADPVARSRGKTAEVRTTRRRTASRLIERAFGWVFGPFNRFFQGEPDRYQVFQCPRILRPRGVVFAVYAVLLAARL